MIPGRRYTLASVGRLLWLQRYLLAFAAVAGAMLSYTYAQQLTDTYRSQATILVLPQQVPQNYVKSTVSQGLDAQLRELRESVLSPARILALEQELRLYPDLGGDATAILQRFQSFLGVQIARSDAFRITFIHRDPRRAAAVVSRVADEMVAQSLLDRTGLAQETDQFIEDQLENTRQRLAEHEEALAEYRRTYAGQLPNQMDSNLQVIQIAQTRLRALEDSIQQDREQRLRTEQSITALTVQEDDTQNDAPIVDFETVPEAALSLRGREARRQLPIARATLAKMELQLRGEHPDIIRLRRVITQLEQRVATDLGDSAGEVTARVDAARTRRIEQLRAEVNEINRRMTSKESEQAQLRDIIARYQERVESIPTRETELTTLMRDYDTLRESYRGLLTKKEETQMAAELERRQVGETMRVIERAQVPARPFTPDRPRIVLSGVLFGLGLGLAFAALRELRDHTLRTEQEVLAALQVPVMAQIPEIENVRDQRLLRFRRVALASAVVVVVVVAIRALLLRFGG